jgi:hypothetical protein
LVVPQVLGDVPVLVYIVFIGRDIPDVRKQPKSRELDQEFVKRSRIETVSEFLSVELLAPGVEPLEHQLSYIALFRGRLLSAPD